MTGPDPLAWLDHVPDVEKWIGTSGHANNRYRDDDDRPACLVCLASECRHQPRPEESA